MNIEATKSWTIHTPYVTVSKGSNNLQHWSSINGSYVWIINISGSLGLFLSEQVSPFIFNTFFFHHVPWLTHVVSHNSQHSKPLQHQFRHRYPAHILQVHQVSISFVLFCEIISHCGCLKADIYFLYHPIKIFRKKKIFSNIKLNIEIRPLSTAEWGLLVLSHS